jgi:hypothetical protein
MESVYFGGGGANCVSRNQEAVVSITYQGEEPVDMSCCTTRRFALFAGFKTSSAPSLGSKRSEFTRIYCDVAVELSQSHRHIHEEIRWA